MIAQTELNYDAFSLRRQNDLFASEGIYECVMYILVLKQISLSPVSCRLRGDTK